LPESKLKQIEPGWLQRSFERARAWAEANPEEHERLRGNWDLWDAYVAFRAGNLPR
jgi:hypothetical protein